MEVESKKQRHFALSRVPTNVPTADINYSLEKNVFLLGYETVNQIDIASNVFLFFFYSTSLVLSQKYSKG